MEAESELAEGHVALGPDESLESLFLDRDVTMLEHARCIGGRLITQWLDGRQCVLRQGMSTGIGGC